LDFELVLLGPAIQALPYFIHIFIEMGRRGLGRERGKYELTRVDLLQDREVISVYEASSRTLNACLPETGPGHFPQDDRVTRLTVQFLTPLRLKEKGDLVTRLTFPFFSQHLIRRLSLLAAFYSGNGTDGPTNSNKEIKSAFPDADLLAAQATEIQVSKNDLYWFDWERYSRRQDASMKLGGLVGRITFSGELGPFLPYLRLGEIVNVGQATTFGLGRFQLLV
jgi:hypothetical protein